MAYFYGSMQGNRGQATRMGTAKSGFTARIGGWNIGASISLHIGDDGKDILRVWKTNGSRGYGQDTLIGEYREGEA